MRQYPTLAMVLLWPMCAGCELVGDIFQAGVWVGVILVIAIIGVALWMFSKAGR